MKTLILEDDQNICGLIKTILEKYFSKSIQSIDIANNVDEAVKLINITDYDLFLFDIQLGSETSFDVFKIIEKTNAKIVFITGNENYAINAIKVNAFDYILKPINLDEFKESIEKVVQLISINKKNNNLNQFIIKQEKSLVLKALDSIKMVKLNEVIYLEADGPYTNVYLTNNEKITVSKHMKDFENKIENTGFFRIHNSFIINTLKMNSINKKDGLFVIMNNKKNIIISSRKKDAFFQFIENYLEI